MRTLTFLILTLLISYQALAYATECPTYPTHRDCLEAVDKRYWNLIEALEEAGEDGEKEFGYLVAANDVRHFETQSCHTTCIH